MSILTVEKATIEIGKIAIDAYTANEIDPVTEAPINYLSGVGLAESIGLTDFTTRSKSLPKELKAMLGESFTTRGGKFKNSTGAYSKINLWDTTSAATYYLYHALQGNTQAQRIMVALNASSLDVIINDKFKRVYQAGQIEKWTKSRIQSKEAFWSLGEAIVQYKTSHPERSDTFRAFVFPNCQDTLNRGLFGKTASTIRNELGVKDLLRDHYGQVALRRIDLVQSLAASLIVHEDQNPVDAVKQSLGMYRFDLIDYRE